MNAPSDLERLSALIDFIYRGATEPALWPEIIADTCGWLGSPKGMLYTPLHGKEQGGYYFQHGLSEFFLELYKARYQSVDMWTQQAVERRLFKQGNVILGTDLVPYGVLIGSDWYRDCLRVGDIAHLLTSVVFGAPSSQAGAPAQPRGGGGELCRPHCPSIVARPMPNTPRKSAAGLRCCCRTSLAPSA